MIGTLKDFRRASGARRPSVLVINQFALPTSMPGGTRHAELFSRLVGWDAHIIANGHGYMGGERKDSPEDGMFTFVSVPAHEQNGGARVYGWIAFAARATIAGLRRPAVDIVYASSPHLLAAVAGWLVARLRGSRFVLELRDLWPETLVSAGALRRGSIAHRSLRALELWLYRRADHIVGVVDAWADYLEDCGIGGKFTAVSNGADVEAFEGITRWARADQLPDRRAGGLRFVYAGSHGPANGLHALLDCATARHQHDFILVGAGLAKDSLVERVHNERIGNVMFLDAVPKCELPQVLREMDVGVHVIADLDVLQRGMSPNKLFDYMAASLPVLTNAAGARGLVEESDSGVAVAPAELPLGADQLARMSDQQRVALGEYGNSWLRATRSRQEMAERLQDCLERLIP